MSGTESRNPKARGLSGRSTREVLELMNDEDTQVAGAVRLAIPEIARAVDAIVDSLAKQGQVIYVGAGTSGRLGVLDASEMPPTFGVPPELFRAVIAGGDTALRLAVEGAEDDEAAGRRDVTALAVGVSDVVVGISASGSAPYVLGGVAAAEKAGAVTVGITCNAGSALARTARIPIVVDVGPEVIAGSSRLKAGTATKLVLNMLSTGAMVRSGRTRDDLMVDMHASNAKLRERAIGIVSTEAGIDEPEARRRLEAVDWSVREALDRQR